MKIFLGPAGSPSVSGSVIDGIKVVRQIGLNSMEVEFTFGVRMSNENAKEAGKIAKKNNVRLSVHAPYYINLCNPEKLADSKKRILDSCERAHHMGATIVVFHPGFYQNLRKEEAFERVKRACIDLEKTIRKKKWDVILGLETTGKHTQFGSLDEIIRLSKEIKVCEPVVDWAHIYARNNGVIDYRDIIRKVAKLNIDVIHSHFSGIEFSEKGEKRHLPISSGTPPFDKLADAILKSKHDINIICESPELEDDALLMKDIFHHKRYKLK
ncbi:MAG: TIM barrel protein [Candidatus Aenigmarchaeota archaeon]|nr:TIM barrel protein [Candidatus Aenigmarchaeota archaeon]